MISYNPIFKRLNKYFLPGEVYLLTSSENSGRTTLADNIVIEFLKNDIAARILYFDGSNLEHINRIMANINNQDYKYYFNLSNNNKYEYLNEITNFTKNYNLKYIKYNMEEELEYFNFQKYFQDSKNSIIFLDLNIGTYVTEDIFLKQKNKIKK